MKDFLLVTAFLFFGLFCYAQNNLHLNDAITIAVKNSLEIQLAKDSAAITSINNNYGVAGGLPLITGSISNSEQVSNIYQETNTGAIITSPNALTNTFPANITGSVLLYNGNRVVATKHSLEMLDKQNIHQLNSRVQNVIAGVMNSYYDVVRQQSYQKTLVQSIDVAKQKLSIVQTRQNAGLANNADLFQAQIDLNAAVQAKEAQIIIIGQSKTELLRRLTLNPDSAINVDDTIIIDKSIELNNILNSLTKNTDLVAADDQIKINELAVQQVKALRYPSIKATTGFNFSRNYAAAGSLITNQGYGPFLGVSVGIPIYNGSIYKRQEKAATVNVQIAQAQKEILKRDFNALVVKIFQSYSNTINQINTEQENYKLSNQLLSLVLQKFQLREATIVDVKNAQQSFEASGYRLVNLNYAAKTAEITLKQLANQLSL